MPSIAFHLAPVLMVVGPICLVLAVAAMAHDAIRRLSGEEPLSDGKWSDKYKTSPMTHDTCTSARKAASREI
jgi:hypothetical protein